jgi:TolA-binding protein
MSAGGATPNPPTGSEPAAPVHVSEEEGLRAWIALVDRKLGTRSYAGAAAVILALAASIVAIVLAIDARDNSAGQDDVVRLENQLNDFSSQADAAKAAQSDVAALEERISGIEGEIDTLNGGSADIDQRISVIEDDIDDLRGQISDLEPGGANSSGGAADTPPASAGGTSPGGGGTSPGGGGTSPGDK